MKEEDKQLLLADLCGRLPYGVKVTIEYSKGKYTRIYDLREIDNDTTSELRQQVTVWTYGFYSSVISYPLIDCRPYLRPMSSMTEDEAIEFIKLTDSIIKYVNKYNAVLSLQQIDWLNAHHFDFRNLIEKGLAIEVTKENNPYKD